MEKRAVLVIAAFALAVGACAADTDSLTPAGSAPTEEVAVTTAPTTTTTTVSPATPTTAPTTTTTAAPTTTTTAAPFSPELLAMQTAFERSAAVSSGRMEGLIEITGLDPSQGPTEIRIPFGGAFDNATGNFSFSMDLSGIAAAAEDDLPPEFAGMFDEMEVRQIGDRAYLKFPFFAVLFGAETPWISMPAEEGDVATSGFSATAPGNPSEILGSFEDAGATVEVIGTETINGVTATHYRAVFDMEALLAQATPEERAELEARGPLPLDFLPMDVWISDDGLVVRFVMEIDGSAIETTPEESFGRLLMRYDLFDLGSDVVIEPPPPGEVTAIEDLEGSLGFAT
ncbi:MAG: hypothetical protein BMS9Abin07_0314 [Acidimicrobiia bacterium]|nr:MAG: hypothetical protein BMS9Abin07_0314 [Acidimicrobiia bacterium]